MGKSLKNNNNETADNRAVILHGHILTIFLYIVYNIMEPRTHFKKRGETEKPDE